MLSILKKKGARQSKPNKYLHESNINNWHERNGKNNIRDTNYFTQKFTECLCGEWLLVNENMILMVSLNENQ